MYLCVCVSVCLSVCLANYLPIYLPMYSSIHPSIYPSVHPSIHRSVDPLIYLSTHLPSSIYISTDLPIYLPMYLSTYPAIHPSSYPSIYLSVHISIYPIYPKIHVLCVYIYINASIYLSVCMSVCLSIYASIQFYTSSINCIVKTWSKPAHKISQKCLKRRWSIPPNSSRSSLQWFWSKHHSMDPAIQSSPMDFSGRPNGDRKLLWHASMRRKTLAKHLKIYKNLWIIWIIWLCWLCLKKWGWCTPHTNIPCSMFHGQLGGFSSHERHHLKMWLPWITYAKPHKTTTKIMGLLPISILQIHHKNRAFRSLSPSNKFNLEVSGDWIYGGEKSAHVTHYTQGFRLSKACLKPLL